TCPKCVTPCYCRCGRVGTVVCDDRADLDVCPCACTYDGDLDHRCDNVGWSFLRHRK
ncbi:unnamed protein product, partial [Rotaria sordida]